MQKYLIVCIITFFNTNQLIVASQANLLQEQESLKRAVESLDKQIKQQEVVANKAKCDIFEYGGELAVFRFQNEMDILKTCKVNRDTFFNQLNEINEQINENNRKNKNQSNCCNIC